MPNAVAYTPYDVGPIRRVMHNTPERWMTRLAAWRPTRYVPPRMATVRRPVMSHHGRGEPARGPEPGAHHGAPQTCGRTQPGEVVRSTPRPAPRARASDRKPPLMPAVLGRRASRQCAEPSRDD